MKHVPSSTLVLKAVLANTHIRRELTAAYANLSQSGTYLREFIEFADSQFGMNVELHPGHALFITTKTSRAAKPACAIISPNCGQLGSPSAQSLERIGNFLLQIFEAGADDGMEESRSRSPNRIDRQNRVLFY